MENLEIVILNLEKLNFKNQKTGEVNEMVRVTYGSLVPDEERFSGLAILETYQNVKFFDTIKEFIGKKVNANFKKIPLKNGFKYSLVSINNKELK